MRRRPEAAPASAVTASSVAAAGAAAAPAAGAAERRLRGRAVHGEGGELLEHVRRLAGRARDHLVLAADELVEVLLALHARVLVDRHGTSVLSGTVEGWTTPTLTGRVVRLEPLAPRHADDLWEASRDPLALALAPGRAAADAGRVGRVDGGRPRTHRRGPRARLRDRARHRREGGRLDALPQHPGRAPTLEIGWTWLAPSAWGTGANAEAKLLQLEYAFETLGCRRVEFKTDALNERARPALAALPAQFEGIFRKHMLVRDGVSRDSAWYSVVDDDWPVVRDTLRERLAAS